MIIKEYGQITTWKAIIKDYPSYVEGTEENIYETASKESLLEWLLNEFMYETSMLMLEDDERAITCRQRRIRLLRETIINLFNCPIE